jgi:hypothetical protein
MEHHSAARRRRCANRDLALPRVGSDQHQVSHVGTGDEQQQGRRTATAHSVGDPSGCLREGTCGA